VSVFIGIDGGGTKTTAVVTDAAGEVLARVEGERGRIDPLDPAAGAAALVTLAREALSSAGQPVPAESLCCALSGAGRQAERALLEKALSEHGVARTNIVVPDAEAALQDAFGTSAGILLICGTGSIAWGRSEDGTITRAGGWGWLIGDEGSGYAIGLAAVRAAMRVHDGRLGDSALLPLVLEQTGVAEPDQLVRWSASAGTAGMAGLAPRVIALAGEDTAASAIVDAAARELAAHVAAVHARLEPWSGTAPVAFTGGLVAPGGPMRVHVESALSEWGLDLALLDRAVDAALGAAVMARYAVAL
jgi:N-acetylglucosamine kinase-like BadF-type ATPase